MKGRTPTEIVGISNRCPALGRGAIPNLRRAVRVPAQSLSALGRGQFQTDASGAVRRLIWLLGLLVTDWNKLQTAMDLVFWGKGQAGRIGTPLWLKAASLKWAVPFRLRCRLVRC